MDHGIERRRYPRAGVDIRVERPAAKSSPAERLRDLSLGGALLLTSNPLPAGSPLELRFHLPEDPTDEKSPRRPLAVQAEVVHSRKLDERTAMAVRFTGLSLAEQVLLGSYVSAHRWQDDPEAWLPEAPVIGEDAGEADSAPDQPMKAAPAYTAGTNPSPASAEPAAENAEWNEEGFVVLSRDSESEVTRELAEQLGEGFIIVETKK